MIIDIERLARDGAYWDSVAPEGATHYAVGSTLPWERLNEDGSGDFLGPCGGWLHSSDNYLNVISCGDRPRVVCPTLRLCPEEGPRDSVVEIHELAMIAGINVELQCDGTIYLYDGEKALGTTVKNIGEAFTLLEAAKAYADVRETFIWD